MSQQVWNTFTKKMYFAPKNCFLSLFCELQEMKMDFWNNFSPISNNLLNILLHKTIGEKLLKNSIFNSCSSQKRLKKQFFGAKYIFFINVARFARKLLGLRTLHLTYSKHVGTPCTSDFLDKKCHFGSVWRLLWW